VEAEKIAEALKEQDIKTKYLNKKLAEARVKLLSERKHLQEEVQKLRLENSKLKKKQK
jgi:cell division protein FtsL